ncbi:MAG: lipase family alpha/beta hydrolase [Thiobacillus sp.]
MHALAALTAVLVLTGCATREVMNPAELEHGQLPLPNVTLNIAGLGPCTDNPDRTLRFDARQPIHVLVHGCYGSSGQFRGLAQVLAFHGQQSACFTYDDRAKLTDSAAELRHALQQLSAQSQVPQITVIGHSQGALIARNALVETAYTSLPELPASVRLVTISGPFAGIASARTCGKTWLYPLTLGFVPLSCYLATGPKWADITYSSRFIREPGSLARQVGQYLKIDTDERDTCRRQLDGRCVEDDEIFSLAEQRNEQVEVGPRMKRREVKAGHVEIVGDKRVAPTKLIEILQDEQVIHPTPAKQVAAFNLRLKQIYLTDKLP